LRASLSRAALGVGVLGPAAQDPGGDPCGVREAAAVGQRHGAYHQGVDRVGCGRDRLLGRDQRLGRLVGRQVDAGQRGEQRRVRRRGAETGRDLTGRLVVAAEVGQ
jgi:hypothetical protein